MANDDYYLICPHCGEETGLDPSMLTKGEQIICPKCAEPIDIQEEDD